MRERLQAAAFAGVRAPCHRLVPSDRAKARTLAASHKARHRLERVSAGDLRHVCGARRVLSTHRQQHAAVGSDSRVVEANDRGAGRGEIGTCDEEIDATSDSARLECCDLGDDAPNLALALRKVNRDMHFVGCGGGKCRNHVVISQRQAVGRERSEQHALEIAKDVKDARVFERLATAKRNRAHAVRRGVANETRHLLRPELDASIGMASAIAKPARLFAALRQLDRHTLDVHSSDHAVTIFTRGVFYVPDRYGMPNAWAPTLAAAARRPMSSWAAAAKAPLFSLPAAATCGRPVATWRAGHRPTADRR